MAQSSKRSKRKQREEDLPVDPLWWHPAVAIGPAADCSVESLYVQPLIDLGRSSGGTCGSSLWCAALALVQWLHKHPQHSHLFAGKNVLEIGAGIGFVGISLRKLGALRVVLTDLKQQLPLLRKNIAANFEVLTP